MSDDKQNDYDSVINAINAKVDEKFNDQSLKLDDAISKLNSLDKDSDKKISSWLDDIKDDEEYISKNDVRKIIQDLKNSMKSDFDKLIDTKISTKDKMRERDAEAFQDFPQMNPSSNEFDKKFSDEIKQEVDRRASSNKNERTNPELLYDVASKIYSKWVRQGLIVPSSIANKMKQETDLKDQTLTLKEKKLKGSNKPSASQIELAKNMGLSEERLAQLIENNR